MKFLLITATLNLLFFSNLVSAETENPFGVEAAVRDNEEITITANYDDESAKTKKYNINGNLHLQCNVSGGGPDVEVKWEKNGEDIESISEIKDRKRITNDKTLYKLSIKHSTEQDAGNYTCKAFKKGTLVGSLEFLVGSNIRVRVPDSINIAEGGTLKIHCIVHGNPPPLISWNVGNETGLKESTDRITLKEDPDKKIPNAILIIDNVEMSDRGEFECVGFSEITKNNVTYKSMIRIKDKYAALWPFLGICAEVFVLCAIIFIYEKKRNKTELEESDTDQSPDQKNTPDHGKESNLRHRQ